MAQLADAPDLGSGFCRFESYYAHFFIKFVDVGETEIYEITDKGDRMDDTMKYEVQRSMGVGTQIGRYFGVWTLA